MPRDRRELFEQAGQSSMPADAVDPPGGAPVVSASRTGWPGVGKFLESIPNFSVGSCQGSRSARRALGGAEFAALKPPARCRSCRSDAVACAGKQVASQNTPVRSSPMRQRQAGQCLACGPLSEHQFEGGWLEFGRSVATHLDRCGRSLMRNSASRACAAKDVIQSTFLDISMAWAPGSSSVVPDVLMLVREASRGSPSPDCKT